MAPRASVDDARDFRVVLYRVLVVLVVAGIAWMYLVIPVSASWNTLNLPGSTVMDYNCYAAEVPTGVTGGEPTTEVGAIARLHRQVYANCREDVFMNQAVTSEGKYIETTVMFVAGLIAAGIATYPLSKAFIL